MALGSISIPSTKPAPRILTEDLVKLMKPGSIVYDLAAEQGGNCDLTKPNKLYKTSNNVTIIGYTDLPSRMATQSSNLYSTNIRHMLSDLTPDKNGKINIIKICTKLFFLIEMEH